MASEFTQWVNEELIPAGYDRIDEVFPQLKLKRKVNKWVSPLNIDGTEPQHRRQEKTVIKQTIPAMIFENGEGGHKRVIDAVMEFNKVDWYGAVKILCDITGMTAPNTGTYEPEQYRTRENILHDAQGFFIDSLNTPEADQVNEYLNGRGYTQDEIHAMQLGFIPSQTALMEHLAGRGYTTTQVDEVLKLNGYIGNTHRLTIPYIGGGSLRGFSFRTTTGAEPKYLNSTGLDRSSTFFNMKATNGAHDLVLVEGYLDALACEVRGISNVVALCGTNVTDDQVKHAIRMGAKKITVCLDNDKAGKSKTPDAVRAILKQTGNVYVAILPRDKDPDELIREQGVDAMTEAINKAQVYYEYNLNRISAPYMEKWNTGEFTQKDLHEFIERATDYSKEIENKIHLDIYQTSLRSNHILNNMGVTDKTFREVTRKVWEAEQERKARKQYEDLRRNIPEDPEDGIEYLANGLQEIKRTGSKSTLPHKKTAEDYIKDIKQTPAGFSTGFPSLDEVVSLRPGSTTIIAGRPGQGKTTLMANMMLRMALKYGKDGYVFKYFHYEQQGYELYINLINHLLNKDEYLAKYCTEYPEINTPGNIDYLTAYLKDPKPKNKQDIEKARQQVDDLINSGIIQIIGNEERRTAEELYNAICEYSEHEKVGGVFIDFVQRIQLKERTSDIRTATLKISRLLLDASTDAGVPVIAGSQVNERKDDKTPRLGNLKESGNLEEDASTVLSIEKDDTTGAEMPTKNKIITATLTILKNRKGTPGEKRSLNWTGASGRMYDTKDGKQKEQSTLNLDLKIN